MLLGDNGAGKTSLLEAVYLVATTRSFRAPRLAECVRHGGDGFYLGAGVAGDRRAEIAMAWSAESGVERTVNGSAASLTEHLEVLPVVAWSSADLELIAGGPDFRRRFLDQGVVGGRPGALAVLARYRRALEQKRRLLADGARGLAAWNEVLAPAAGEIARLRSSYAVRLAERAAEVISASGLELPPVELSYRPSPAAALEGVGAIAAALDRVRERERERRMPLVGPHRDELEIRWGGHEVKRVASAGERKLIGLVLTAARCRTLEEAGRRPVLLLDDLDTELDPERLRAVWSLLHGGGQRLVSSNRRAVWKALELDVVERVENGRVRSA